ncbi:MULTISPECIES: phage portal protein [Rhodomicrobium]|uniref:phage portal protein n=1 Tax=Rhodomicrobium TaxID=1068 RepID=UPI000B4AC150|nr:MULTISPECIES: phage portal protein [Rhodomicrobium]
MSELVAYTREGLEAVVEARLAERRASLESPSVSLADAAAWQSLFGAWASSAAGVAVSRDSALGVPAVWAAVNFIASTIATLPLDLYQRTGDDRALAVKDPLYAILHDDVNEEMSSFAWRKLAMQNVLLSGRSCSFIERNVARRIINLWPLDPAKVTVTRREGKTRYLYREGTRERVYAAAEIIDIPWMLRSDGLSHYEPIERLRNTIGLAIAMEEYAAKFFRGGGVPPLQLVGPMETPGAIARAATDITEALQAARSEGRPILPMPLMHELKAIGFDPEKGQLTDSRRFQLEELARMYQLPPVFLQDLTKGTLANTEQQDLHFVKHTLSQWIKAWEQELNLKLFGPRRRDRFVEFNVDGLLRGDFKTRMEGYAKAIQNAINTPDEIRAMENWAAHGGDAGKLHIQGATVPLGQQLQRGAVPASPNPTEAENE